MGVEIGWRKCIKCSEMFFLGSVAGACAAGGSHDSGDSTNPRFIGIIDPIAQGTYISFIKTMPGWRRCQYCQCMFFVSNLAERMRSVFYPGSAELKVCPAIGGGGKHDATGSPNYLVTTFFVEFDPAAPYMVSGWLRCAKCYAFFETSDDNTGGVCVSDGKPHTGIRTWLFACQEQLERLPLSSMANTATKALQS